MPTDYRRATPPPPTPARPTPKRKQSRSCVWWFLMGAALGVFAGRFHSDAPESSSGSQSPAAAQRERPASERPDFRFEFERILDKPAVELENRSRPLPPSAPRPQPQVVEHATIPPPPELPAPLPPEPARKPVEPPSMPPETPVQPGSYVVQVASVRRAADAERLKAELAMRGIIANVQSATLPDGQTTYRVRLGPYANKQAAEQARAALRRQGKDSVTYPVR